MSSLIRTVVDRFKIEDSYNFEDLEKGNYKIWKMEEIFSEIPKIELNSRKKELFLNGVMLTFEVSAGLYNIYSEGKYPRTSWAWASRPDAQCRRAAACSRSNTPNGGGCVPYGGATQSCIPYPDAPRRWGCGHLDSISPPPKTQWGNTWTGRGSSPANTGRSESSTAAHTICAV